MRIIKYKIIATKKQASSISVSKERLQVCRGFFKAFDVPQAREFVRQMMIDNYYNAIFVHHPDPDSLDPSQIKEKCERLVNTVFDRLTAIRSQPEKLIELMKELSRTSKPRSQIWFEEYETAYKNYKYTNKMANRDRMLSPFLRGKSLVDIGCGGGDLVDYFGRQHDELERVAGMDILDWRTPGLDIDYHVIDFSKPGTTSPVMYDTGLLLAVLHHVSNDKNALITFLSNVRTAVNQRLIVEEDVILTAKDLQHPKLDLEDLQQKRRAQPLLDAYIDLDPDIQKAITTLVDVLSNSLSVGVPEMAFPYGFQTLTAWIDIFKESGFDVESIQIVGFHPGNFNPQCHLLFILNPA